MGEKSEVGLLDGFVFGLVWFREPVLGLTAKKMFDYINRRAASLMIFLKEAASPSSRTMLTSFLTLSASRSLAMSNACAINSTGIAYLNAFGRRMRVKQPQAPPTQANYVHGVPHEWSVDFGA